MLAFALLLVAAALPRARPAVVPAFNSKFCERSSYYPASVLNCQNTTVTVPFDLADHDAATILIAEPPLGDVFFEISASPFLHVKLIDETAHRCVVGPDCLHTQACANAADYCISYGGVLISMDGDPFGSSATRTLKVSGFPTWTLSIVVYATGASPGITSRYSFDGCSPNVPPCPSCSAFLGCFGGEIPVCPAAPSWKLSCIERQSIRIGSAHFNGGGGSDPPLCGCCHLPFNATPVKFGTALTLTMEPGTLAFDLRRAYKLFFSWLNQERGGLCVGGQRRPAELTLVGDSNRGDHVQAITNYLILQEDVKLLLAPYGSSLTELAAGVAHAHGAVLVAPASSSTSVFRGRPTVFGTLPPASLNLGGVFEVLQASQGAEVSAIIEDSSFGTSACGVVPQLAQQYGLQVGRTKMLSSSPTSAEIEAAVREVLNPQNGILIGCVRKDSVCNNIVKSIHLLGMAPKAVALTVCVMTASFNLTAGRFVMGTTAWLPDLQLRAGPTTVDYVAAPMWNSSSWADVYTEVYAPEPPTGFVVSYQAASSWAACVTLATAIEQANSTEPSEVAAALRGISIDTIFGKVAFDSNGQNTGLWNVVQYQGLDDSTHFVAPLSLASSQAIFPYPPFNEQQCWLAAPAKHVKGLNSLNECVSCPLQVPPMISLFNATRKHRFCQSCPVGEAPVQHGDVASCMTSCPAGQGLVNATVCQTCPAGSHSVNGQCVLCLAGTFSARPGKAECATCPMGSFSNVSGATACHNCTVGEASSQTRSTSCRSCSRGTFADTEGTSSCSLCLAGTVATGIAASTCDSCNPGFYSAWGAHSCEMCESGKYQNQKQMSDCIFGGGLGASFTGVGLESGINKPRYWTRRMRTNLSWELCLRAPEACLTEDLCEQGCTGKQCYACLPGYAHQRTRARNACFKCPPFVLNVSMTVVAVLVTVGFVFWLARNITHSIRQPQDLRMMLVKALIFYFMMADVAFEMMGDVSLDYLIPKVVTAGDSWDVTASLIYWLIMPFRLLPGYCLVSESAYWSVNCLFQPPMHELAETVGQFRHTDYYNRTLASEWDKLARFHHNTELRVAIFWAVWPLFISVIAYILGLLYVVRQLRRNDDFYTQALDFYEDLLENGSKRAIRARTQDAWTAYVRTYDYRICGLWWPIAHAEALRDGRARCVYWRVFNREAKAVIQCSVLVCQGAALVGTMRAFGCSSFGPNEGPNFTFANTLACADMSLMLYKFSTGAHIAWGVLLPFVVWLSLRRATSKSHWNTGLEEHSVLLQGYAFHAWYWEAVSFLMKYVVLVIAHTMTTVQVKNVLLLLLAMGYGLMSTLSLPFQSTHDGLAQRTNGQFILLWISQSIFTQLLFLLAAHEPEAWVILVGVCFIMLFHLAFLFNIFWHFYYQTLDSFMTGVDIKAWMRSLEEPKSRNIVTFIRRRLLGQYIRHLSAKPYVCLDNDFNWVTVCGNRADHAMVPHIPRGEKTGLPNGKPDLSAAPTVPEDPPTKRAKESHQQELQRCVQSAVGLVIEVLGMPTFSLSLLEFVMRAGIMFAAEHEKQRRHISFLHRKLMGRHRVGRKKKAQGLQEITVTAGKNDPMELLGDSHEEDGRASVPMGGKAGEPGKPRTNLWQVARIKLQKKAEAESEEIADLKRRCEEVREREMLRRDGDMPESTRSVVIRKRASAAMNQTMFWLQATSAFERLWIRVRMWLQRKQLDKDEERDYIRSAQNSRSMESQEIRNEPMLTYEAMEKYRQKIDAMFAPTVFARGVELSSLQLGFMDLIAVPPQEMRYWLDEFEKRYGQNKDLQSHQMKRLGNMVRDAYTQTSTDRKEILGSEVQQTAVYTHDRFTVAWLPKLGILPGQSSKGKKVTRATAPVDAGTQTSMFDFEELGPLRNKVYAPFKDRGDRAIVAWAHFVTQISLPDLKVMGPLLHERQTRSVKDLMQQLEVAKMKRVAVQRERQALERRGTSKEAVGSVASSCSRTPSHTTLAVGPVPSAQSVRGSTPMMKRPSLSLRKGKYED